MAYTIDPTVSGRFRDYKRITSTNLSSITNTLTATIWNDPHYDIKYGTPAKQYMNKLGDTEVVSSQCIVFWADYLRLTELTPDSLRELYKTILPGMTMSGCYVIISASLTVGSTLATPEVDIANYVFPTSGTSLQLKTGRYTKDDVRKFWDLVTKLRSSDVHSRQKLINLTGFTMINCLRLIRKETACLDNHMPESGTRSFQSLYSAWLTLKIPPPGLGFSSRFQTSFPSNAHDTKMIFACLINEWIRQQADPDFLGMLKAGGLLALADNGLGLVSWTVKAAEKLGVEIGTYMNAILVDQQINDSMTRLLDFIERKDRGVTWPWCCLFEESALFELSTKKNKDATVLSAIIVLGSPDPLMTMSQFSKMELYIQRYDPTARAVMKYFAHETGGVVGSEVVRAIMMTRAREPEYIAPPLVQRPQTQAESPEPAVATKIFFLISCILDIHF